MKHKLATNVNLLKKYGTKEGADSVKAYSDIFTTLMTSDKDKKE